MLSVIAGGLFDRPSAKVKVKDAEFTRTVQVSSEDVGALAHPYISVKQTGPVLSTGTGTIVQHSQDGAGLLYNIIKSNAYSIPFHELSMSVKNLKAKQKN